MVFGAFNIHNMRLWRAICLITLNTGKFGQLVNFLLGNDDGVLVVQAAEVDVLLCVVLGIDFIKNLPRHVKLDALPDHF